MKGITMAKQITNYMQTKEPDYYIRIGVKGDEVVELDWKDMPKSEIDEPYVLRIYLLLKKAINMLHPDSPLTEEQPGESKGVEPLTEEQIRKWLNTPYLRKIGDDNAQMFIDFQRYLFGVPKDPQPVTNSNQPEKQTEEKKEECEINLICERCNKPFRFLNGGLCADCYTDIHGM